jgi:hypothetical protein
MKNYTLIRRTQRMYPLEGKHCNRCPTDAKPQRHHRDRDRSNNSPENVEFLCHKCHERDHIEAGDWGRMKPRLTMAAEVV